MNHPAEIKSKLKKLFSGYSALYELINLEEFDFCEEVFNSINKLESEVTYDTRLILSEVDFSRLIKLHKDLQSELHCRDFIKAKSHIDNIKIEIVIISRMFSCNNKWDELKRIGFDPYESFRYCEECNQFVHDFGEWWSDGDSKKNVSFSYKIPEVITESDPEVYKSEAEHLEQIQERVSKLLDNTNQPICILKNYFKYTQY